MVTKLLGQLRLLCCGILVALKIFVFRRSNNRLREAEHWGNVVDLGDDDNSMHRA